MDNLQKAWIFSIAFTILGPIASIFNGIVAVVIVLLHLFVVGHFIAEDAISRGRSKFHQLWAWLGIITSVEKIISDLLSKLSLFAHLDR